jgi:hypothetical protein
MAWTLGDVARIEGLERTTPRCARKLAHPTYYEAEAHRLSVLHNHGDDGAKLNVYQCRHCGSWHVGRDRYER